MKKAASTTKRTTSKKPKTEGLGVIGELDRYLFGEGRHYQLYHKLGAHPYTYRGQDGYYFAVWAPHAASRQPVSATLTAWNPDATPDGSRSHTAAFMSTFIPGRWPGTALQICRSPRTDGERFYSRQTRMHFQAEYRPGTASVTDRYHAVLNGTDSKWMESRRGQPIR